jgi:hypothetical protein
MLLRVQICVSNRVMDKPDRKLETNYMFDPEHLYAGPEIIRLLSNDIATSLIQECEKLEHELVI